jgi:hypothetical protein
MLQKMQHLMLLSDLGNEGILFMQLQMIYLQGLNHYLLTLIEPEFGLFIGIGPESGFVIGIEPEFGFIIVINAVGGNALSPILITEFGIVTDTNDVQFANALLPISVTEFGIVTDTNDVQL